MRNDLEKMSKKDLIDIVLKYKDDLDFTKGVLESSRRNENRLEKENKCLEKEVKELKKQLENKNTEILELVKENSELEFGCNVHKIKNERGAGRKKKCNDKQIAKILEARKQNKSMRAIAKEFSISLGLVQKIISEHKED